MIRWPFEHAGHKRAVFAELARAAGGGRAVLPGLSFRDYPQTEARVAEALARAKKRPAGGFALWVKRQLLRSIYNASRRHFATHPVEIAAAWNGMGGARMAFLNGARDAGAATLHAELAPFPGRITLDPAGVNAENSVPRDPAFFLEWAAGDESRQGDDWRAMGTSLTARRSRRSDVGQGTDPPPDTPFLFCPLQVPTDSQVTLFAGWTGGMAGFLAALTEAAPHLPPGWHLRVKEHPSAHKPLGSLLAPLVATGRVVIDNATDSFAQLAAARGIVTLNSSMGLQAFFYDKPVIAVGRAFWALPGLAAAPADQPALNAAFANLPPFDPALRGAFMIWLDRVYYPRFPGDLSHALPPRPGLR